MGLRKKQGNQYSRIWDTYIKRAFPKIQSSRPNVKKKHEPWRVLNRTDSHYDWPGDEWGDKETAARLLDESLAASLGEEAENLVELGAGAGRYTILALKRYKNAKIMSFDVSKEFEKALRKRCHAFMGCGRLRTYLLDERPFYMLDTIKKEKLLGKIDGMYSFDAMVHVDLHTLIVYWISAVRILRPGGVLAMSVADACSEKGFMKLLHDAPNVYSLRGNVGSHFMWLSRDIVENTLNSLGFCVAYPPGNGRDLFFSAKLMDPEKGAACSDFTNL